jgi:steroid delta-isomerase-like uncharacterized protein
MNIADAQAARLETNMATIRRFYEALDDHVRADLLDEFVTPDFLDMDHAGIIGAQGDLHAFATYLLKFRKAFPDSRSSVDAMTADGEHVMVRRTQDATHQGFFAGLPPSGKRVRLPSIDIFQLALGRIAQYWHMYDGAVLLQELQQPAAEAAVHSAHVTKTDGSAKVSSTQSAINKEVVRYMHERIDRHDLSVLDEVLAPDFVDHGAAGVPPTAQGIKMMYERVHKGLPDAYTVIHSLLTQDDTVVVRRSCYCTHAGEMWGVPASGRRVSVGLINWFNLRNGQIEAHWHAFDSIGLHRRLLGLPQTPYV